MILFKKIPVTVDEKDYEIRLYYDTTVIDVVAFADNRPVNGFRYHIQIPKKADAKGILEMGGADDLVETCSNDLLERRWGRVSEIIQRNIKE